MNCQLCQQELSAYLDHELSETVADQLQGHLATCSSCQAEYESLREVQVMLHKAKVFNPDPILWIRIEERITRRKVNFWETVLSVFQELRERYSYPVAKPILVGSLAILLLLMGTFSFYRYYENRAILAWVEQNSVTPIDLSINPFSLQIEESLEENPFAPLSEVSLDLNINYFSSSDPLEGETLEKNPFSI